MFSKWAVISTGVPLTECTAGLTFRQAAVGYQLKPHPSYASEAGTHRSDCSEIRTRGGRACSPDRANAKRTPNEPQSGVATRARSARACSASPATVASCHWSPLQRV